MTNSQKEELRHEVLSVLASRQETALTSKQILHRTAKEVDFAIDPVAILAALYFLEGMTFVKKTTDGMGTTEYFQATSAGVLTWERSQQPNQPRHD
jgi:Fe2+ or Zn2+ uptake regulation protein